MTQNELTITPFYYALAQELRLRVHTRIIGNLIFQCGEDVFKSKKGSLALKQMTLRSFFERSL